MNNLYSIEVVDRGTYVGETSEWFICYPFHADFLAFPVKLAFNAFVIQIVLLDMKGSICHFEKWQIHPFISKRAKCSCSLHQISPYVFFNK